MKIKTVLIFAAVMAAIALSPPAVHALQDRTVKDMAGRTVKLNSSTDRIITTFKPATLCVLSLGLQSRLVGVDTSSIRDRLNAAVFPEIAEIKGVGTKTMGLNYETILSLKPDLVILYAQKDGLELAAHLEKMNIPSIIILPENFKGIKASLRLIADAAGDMKSVARAEKAMDSVLETVEKKVASIPENSKKTAYFASTRGLYSTATGNMLQDEMFSKAGLINVSHDLRGYFQDISPEQLIKWNPDMIIISQHMKSSRISNLDTASIRDINAVKNRQIYRSPSNLAPWDFPSPISVLGVLWLAEKAYPDLFQDTDLLKEINGFHQTLFNKSLDQMGGRLNDRIDAFQQ